MAGSSFSFPGVELKLNSFSSLVVSKVREAERLAEPSPLCLKLSFGCNVLCFIRTCCFNPFSEVLECATPSYGAAAGSWLVKVWLYRGGFAAAGVPILGTVFGELFQKSFLVKKRWTGQFSSCFYQNLDAGQDRGTNI